MRDEILDRLERHSPAIRFGVAAFVLFLGIIYSLYLGEKIRYYDAEEYLALAQTIVETGTFSFKDSGATAARPPGYPFFLSCLKSLGGGIVSYRLANFLLLGISILLLFRLSADMGGKPAGAVAVLCVLGYPAHIYLAGTLYPQTLAATLFLAALVLIGVKKPPGISRSAGAGIILGLLILTVPIFILSLLVILLWLFIRHGARAWKTVPAITIPVILTLSIWSYRNYRVFKEFFFVSTNGGLNLILGNSENARPGSGPNTDISGYREQSIAMGEAERDRFLRSKAIEWIAANKKDALVLYGKKVLRYFHYHDDLGNEALESHVKDWIMFVTYYFFLLLFLLRLIEWRWKKPSGKEILLVLLYLSNAFFMAIFFTRIRFRLPLDYLLLALAAVFIVESLRKSQFKEALGSGQYQPRYMP